MTRYRMTPAPRLVLDRATRESLDPIDRVAERYEHLTLDNLRVRFQQPAEPAPPAPEPPAPAPEPESPAVPEIPETNGSSSPVLVDR